MKVMQRHWWVAAAAAALFLPFIASVAADGVTFGPNVLISNGDPTGLGRVEAALAGNPTDVKNRVAVFRATLALGAGTSCLPTRTTNGSTWQVGGPLPVKKGSDFCDGPSIVVDETGTFYASYRDADVDKRESSGVTFDVSKSVDGGATFTGLAVAVPAGHGQNDLYIRTGHIAIDTNAGSPFHGSIYASVDSFSFENEGLVAAVFSRDGGATWSDPAVVAGPIVSGTNYFGNSLPVIAPDGTVYVFYTHFDAASFSIEFVKSTNGGVSWSAPGFVVSAVPNPGAFLLKTSDPDYGVLNGHGLLSFSYPAAAAAPDGSLYVAWADVAGGTCNFTLGEGAPPCSDSNVRLSVSHNAGESWSAPVKVSDDAGTTDQFQPGLAVQRDGKISLTWYDRRLDPGNINYDIYYTYTTDGVSFLPNVRVTDQSSGVPAGVSRYLGQWNGPGTYRDQVFAVWVDNRTGVRTIFTSSAKTGS